MENMDNQHFVREALLYRDEYKAQKDLSLTPSDQGLYKMNVYEHLSKDRKVAEIGALIRDDQKEFIGVSDL